MTEVVNFVLFLLFCSFIKRRTGWQSAQRNFVLSILSEKPCLNVYWKLLFWPLCSLNRQQGSFLFVENKQTTNIFLKGHKSLYFCLLGTGNELETFLKFSSVSLSALFRLFQFLSQIITMSWRHLFCTFPVTTLIQIKTSLKTGCVMFKRNTCIWQMFVVYNSALCENQKAS